MADMPNTAVTTPEALPIELLLESALARRRINDFAGVTALCLQILERAPAYPPVLNLLGETRMRLGDLSTAVALLSHAVAQAPADVEAQNNLGAALGQSGRLDDAEKAFRAVVRLAPDFGAGWLNLGSALRDLGRRDEALPCFQRATQLLPGHAEAHMQLGALLRDSGHPEIAISHLYRALAANSGHAETLATLGVTLAQMGEPEQGAHYLEQAVERDPNLAEAHCNLGLILLDARKAEDAAASINRALAINPKDARFHNALGAVRQRQGLLIEAIACFRTALQLQPSFVNAHSNLIFTLDLDPATDASAALAERRNWNERHALPLLPAIRPHANDARPSRRLRIGYVSGDFKQHSASDVLAPLVMGHTDAFEVYCYSEVRSPDSVTQRYKASAAKWCDSYRLSDIAFADTIRNDQIDILIDLAGFTAGSRLLVFARKPAPIQVGLTLGSGMDAMDYVLSDKIHIPESDSCNYVEQVVRLPTYFAFLPPDEAPPISALPAQTNGYITFGVYNRWTKVTEKTINTWAKILVQLPNSRLLLKDGAFDDAATRARVRRLRRARRGAGAPGIPRQDQQARASRRDARGRSAARLLPADRRRDVARELVDGCAGRHIAGRPRAGTRKCGDPQHAGAGRLYRRQRGAVHRDGVALGHGYPGAGRGARDVARPAQHLDHLRSSRLCRGGRSGLSRDVAPLVRGTGRAAAQAVAARVSRAA